jgi:hypothetical protein
MGNLAVARVKELGMQEGMAIHAKVIEVVPPLPPPPGFQGSPTILINGKDLEPSARGQMDTGHG